MSGEETFEFAAAIAGVSIGLSAALILATLAIVGTWRLFRHATEASEAATRSALSVEELARHIASQPPRTVQAPPAAPPAELADLRQQVADLTESQRRLQETLQGALDAATAGGPPGLMDDIEASISRLDATVGQMATSLANLVQLLERQQSQR